MDYGPILQNVGSVRHEIHLFHYDSPFSMLMKRDDFLHGVETDLLPPHHRFSPFSVFSDRLTDRFTTDPLFDRSTGLEDYFDEFVNRPATSILSRDVPRARQEQGQ